MKSRPTIALAMIVKNEAHNLGPLFESISCCFDKVYITDTGSTDNTIEVLISDKVKEVLGCPVHVTEFQWCDDFSKARQFCFDQVDEDIDFIMWLDADDTLSSKEDFVHFRDNSLHCADMWMATYNYQYDNKGNPTCVHLRERIVRRSSGFKWQFFLHEGLTAPGGAKIRAQGVMSWTVNHRRTIDDLRNDKGRNLKIFEKNKKLNEPFHPRMQFYYGKELYDGGRYLESVNTLKYVLSNYGKTLDEHDRLMAIQYLSMAYGACEKWPESLGLALQGLQLHPERAEYWILAGDANFKMGRLIEAIPFYEGAKRGAPIAVNGFTFTDPNARTIYPSTQLATIYKTTGRINELEREGEILKHFDEEIGNRVIADAQYSRSLAHGPKTQDLIETEDLIISCPPESPCTDWDEDTIKNQGAGGSETACIEIAKFIKKKTGRPVKIFQPRKQADIMESGVEYIPIQKIQEYVFKYKPKAHLAWRHTAPLTPAPKFIWSHDLLTQGGEDHQKYDAYICLSDFHKEFTIDMLRVPKDKIKVLCNGINPDDFKGLEDIQKNPLKVIFSSSPDRGLERCIEIVKRTREITSQPVELHIFYGFENMKKGVLKHEVPKLEQMIKDNAFVHYHGFVNKQELVKHFRESACWLYPADFIETYCISAIEALCAGAYPLVRNMGALPCTLKQAIDQGMATILDSNASNEQEYNLWAEELAKILRDEMWRKVDISPNFYSWEKAADGFIELMGL